MIRLYTKTIKLKEQLRGSYYGSPIRLITDCRVILGRQYNIKQWNIAVGLGSG